jgi:hypothetical protein
VLAGIEGTLVRDTDAWRMVVNVEALHRSVAVEVDRAMFRLLDDHASRAAVERAAVSGAC